MPLSHSDGRRETSRAAIIAAFLQVFFEHGFGGFTIAAVARRAGVGRSTLYAHFPTRHALLEEALAMPFSGLASGILSGRPAEALIPLLQHFRTNQRLGRSLFLPPARAILARALARQIEFRLALLARMRPTTAPLLPLALAASQLAEAGLALIEPWALRQTACPAGQIAAALSASFDGAAAALLGWPSERKDAAPVPMVAGSDGRQP